MGGQNKTYDQIAGKRIQRIEAISDGVFAIALTLLVLDVRVPLNENIKTEPELVKLFWSLTPKLLTYFLSFVTLGIFWTGQSAQFHFIERSDRNLNWITLFFLLSVSMLPFTTAFLSEYITFKFSVGLYWLNLFLLGFLLFINWNYAYHHDFLSVHDEDKEAINKALRSRSFTAQTLYALGALLCFINTYLSITVIILIQLNYALGLSARLSRQNRHTGH